MRYQPCGLCERIKGLEYNYRSERYDAVGFAPASPVRPGHVLVAPVTHVENVLNFPQIAGDVMHFAVLLSRQLGYSDVTVAVSTGVEDVSAPRHMHFHIVPRAKADGLVLPWDGSA